MSVLSLLDRISLGALRPTSTLAAFALVSLGGLGAASADAWKDKGADSDKGAFKSPDDASLGDIGACTKLWAAYRTDLKAVKGDYKKKVVAAMTRLYAEGTDKDAKLAKEELFRIDETIELPKRTAKATTPAAPARKTFAPPPADKKQIAAADKLMKAGLAAAKKKDLDKALDNYLKMTDVAPGYAHGHYNVACVYSLKKDEAKMGAYLMNLRDMKAAGDKVAAEDLAKTQKDTDFDGMRETVAYKQSTGLGYKVMVVNTLGEKGEENVDNLMGSLEKLGYTADSKDSDKKQKQPQIFYAPHARVQAYIIKQLIDHPKTKTIEMSVEDLKGNDVVVQWGDDVKGDPKVYVGDPADAEKKLDALSKKQDEILQKPEDAVDELDEALGKPGEVQDKVEDTLDRPGKAVEKVEKTLDKVKAPFK
ncbi:MAG: hypothetical protein U1F43_17315 [Myxococcota bacterium]